MKKDSKKKAKKLNIKTIQSPFDEDFQKIDLNFDESEGLEAFAYMDSTGCRDADTCTDGTAPYWGRDR